MSRASDTCVHGKYARISIPSWLNIPSTGSSADKEAYARQRGAVECTPVVGADLGTPAKCDQAAACWHCMPGAVGEQLEARLLRVLHQRLHHIPCSQSRQNRRESPPCTRRIWLSYLTTILLVALQTISLPADCEITLAWGSCAVQSLLSGDAQVCDCLEEQGEGPKVLVLAAAGRRGCARSAREVAAEAQREGTVPVNGVQAIVHQACNIATDIHSLCSMTEHAPDLPYNSHALADGARALSMRRSRTDRTGSKISCSMAGCIVKP